jgi:glycosyl hydrolase family 28
LIWGEDLEHIGITGSGVIDANFRKRGGPKPIALKRCRYVTIKGIQILNAPNYAISMLGTDDVNIDGVTILNGYCDGIDPDSCRNVRISNCRIETIDDAIVPKASFSLGERRACEQITVTNCILSTVCNGFKLGTESGGGFRRIAVSNCVITGFKGRHPAISGIALESVDGAVLEDVTVSNITMVDVRAPIFIRLGNRGRDMDTPIPGALRNVSISNVVASRASLACSITGIPGHPVRGVTLSNIRVSYIGSNPRQPSDLPVKEEVARYPEALMFGALPAYGLYCRHVEDLELSNINFGYEDDFWRLNTDIYRDVIWRFSARICVTCVSTDLPLGPAPRVRRLSALRISIAPLFAAPCPPKRHPYLSKP